MLGQLFKSVTEMGVNELWKQHGQQVQGLVVQQLLNVAEEKITQDEELAKTVTQIYQLLPANIAALLPADLVVNKIIENKAVILSQMQQLRGNA
ncbi:hypothetical protein [Acinetobacter sp. B51(2017)]|uniref:hypothetical protein n=1 Tax=Acinetobacter sp. B51(2017) TaxID=2060938 RepID=UPI000F07A87B|nr:hypothetical protein [Acinetobacter sp. B51(2017)]